MTPYTLIYNSKYDEFDIVRPEMRWAIGMPGDRVIREDISRDLLVSWFNALTQKQRYELAHGKQETDSQQLSMAA